jgi:hypothetical protein
LYGTSLKSKAGLLKLEFVGLFVEDIYTPSVLCLFNFLYKANVSFFLPHWFCFPCSGKDRVIHLNLTVITFDSPHVFFVLLCFAVAPIMQLLPSSPGSFGYSPHFVFKNSVLQFVEH